MTGNGVDSAEHKPTKPLNNSRVSASVAPRRMARLFFSASSPHESPLMRAKPAASRALLSRSLSAATTALATARGSEASELVRGAKKPRNRAEIPATMAATRPGAGAPGSVAVASAFIAPLVPAASVVPAAPLVSASSGDRTPAPAGCAAASPGGGEPLGDSRKRPPPHRLP